MKPAVNKLLELSEPDLQQMIERVVHATVRADKPELNIGDMLRTVDTFRGGDFDGMLALWYFIVGAIIALIPFKSIPAIALGVLHFLLSIRHAMKWLRGERVV